MLGMTNGGVEGLGLRNKYEPGNEGRKVKGESYQNAGREKGGKDHGGEN